MALTIEEMRAVCVAHYVERGHTPAHADLIVPRDEKEIRRIYSCIQKEQEKTASNRRIDSRPLLPMTGAAVFLISKSKGEWEPKFWAKEVF